MGIGAFSARKAIYVTTSGGLDSYLSKDVRMEVEMEVRNEILHFSWFWPGLKYYIRNPTVLCARRDGKWEGLPVA